MTDESTKDVTGDVQITETAGSTSAPTTQDTSPVAASAEPASGNGAAEHPTPDESTIDSSPIDVDEQSKKQQAESGDTTTPPGPLVRLARKLANAHQIAVLPNKGRGRLDARANTQVGTDQTTREEELLLEQRTLPQRLTAIGTLLHEAHQQLATTTEEAVAVSYAAEWLLDNFYVVEQALRQVKQDLPESYYRELPRLQMPSPVHIAHVASIPEETNKGQNAQPHQLTTPAGYPRIYALARAFLLYEEFNINPERLTRFIDAYQQQRVLTMGEVWAIPIMLRFILLESIAHAAGHLTHLSEVAERTGTSLPVTLRRELEAHLDAAFDLDDQDIISSAIPSLRVLDTHNWQRFFEANSQVHQTLAQDPAAVYTQMDFASRDRYRSTIEELTQGTTLTERAIAEAAVELAQTAQSATVAKLPSLSVTPQLEQDQESQNRATLFPKRDTHVGYYLVGRGRSILEEKIGYRATGYQHVTRWLLAHPTLTYLGSIMLVTLLLLLLPVVYAILLDALPRTLVGIVLLALIPASTIAVSAVNWAVTDLVPPTLLPKLNLEKGIPTAYAGLVVIPALVNTREEIDGLLEQLEQQYLRNPDPNLRFALLSDYPDANAETQPTDDALMAHAETQLANLNRRYTEQPFYFFHRRRLWNEQEGVWMGWERKRGKLHELNRLLRGATDTSYSVQYGALDQLPQIRYVITLDADTILPRAAAQRLIGTLAHPLNRALFAGQSSKVIDGYTVLQPRTAIQPTSANRSRFTRVFAGDSGLDLYTLAVSDVYQDLFGEGIFVGKGIYEIDSFERSLANRIPDNALLSHDLFEGIHGRAGLVTDIVLYEDYPPNYLVNLVRSHRWVRGDWQLLPWLLPVTPRRQGLGPNDLSLMERWKILDNLRRSILAPALLLLFLAGWTILPGSPLFWTVLALLAPAFSLLAGVVIGIGHAINGNSGTAWQRFIQPVQNNAIRWLLLIAFLPHESLLVVDAIGRTLWRVFLTRRKLLEWTTAASAVRLFGSNVTVETTLLRMLPSIVLVAVVALFVNAVNPAATLISAPFFLVWLLAAELAYWISRPIDTAVPAPSAEQRRQLRVLARRTWLFYEQFVGPDDNWLPPDHFQESPKGVVAHRTSPTNTGLYLLSMLSAHDFGYLGTNELGLRLRFTFDTFHKLDRYRGHFLNWIDTSSLQPLPPSYVSTVDSGNLAGCLIALRQGCLRLPQQRVWRWQWWEGLVDTLTLLDETAAAIDNATLSDMPLRQTIRGMQEKVTTARDEPEAWYSLLAELAAEGRQELDERLAATAAEYANRIDAEFLRNCRIYIERIHHHLDAMQRELNQLLPWLGAFAQTPALFSNPDLPPTVRTAWEAFTVILPTRPRWNELADACEAGQNQLTDLIIQLETLAQGDPINGASSSVESNGTGTTAVDQTAAAVARDWCIALSQNLATAVHAVNALLEQFTELAAEAGTFVREMDFRFLYHDQREVFHIGYNIDAGKLDNNYYDLLASEARIASVIAIAKGDVPQHHWLHLSRPLTRVADGGQALLSWSGTMFEYLMPPLIMQSYPDTLLYQSCHAVVEQQIAYGRQKGIPWGISESGFYTFDAAMNYQYRAFGVPGLGFKRGLSEDLVIAPYASLMATPLRPQAVMQNMIALREYDAMGRYGFYEAIDFTPSHLNLGQDHAVVRSYMAHHQGMIMLALADYLQGKRMVERFHAEPMIQSVELLLQEQIPTQAPLQFPHEDEQESQPVVTPPATAIPWRPPINSPMPLIHYLSNGTYGTLITNAGSGYSENAEVAFTRWRTDTTLDNWGCWLYVQDLAPIDADANPATPTQEAVGADKVDEADSEGNAETMPSTPTVFTAPTDRLSLPLWSIGRQPTGVVGESEDVIFHPHMAEFRRRDHAIGLHMELTVASDYNAEIRRITVTNESDRARTLGLAGYGEVVLAPAAGDRRHPAFAKLFIESEYVAEHQLLIYRRRPRAATEEPTFLGHMLVRGYLPETGSWGSTPYESDRARFLGRGNRSRRPAALTDGNWWSTSEPGRTGATLDPVMALGQQITLPAHGNAQLALVTLNAPTREEIIALARRFHSWNALDRAFIRARSLADREWRQLGMAGSMLEQSDKLLSLLYYPHAAQRAAAPILAANRRGQSSLWAFGISGDYPILLLHMHEEAHGELLQELIQAHTYWRRRGITVDLVIFNHQDTNYGQPLQNYIHRLVRRMESDTWLNQRGGIFPLHADQMGEAERVLLQSAARVVLDGRQGLVADQLADLYQRQVTPLPHFDPVPPATEAVRQAVAPLARPTDLQFDNGYGGFSADGREYVIYLAAEQDAPNANTPAPWINVIANEKFGFLASETGGGYTWAVNSGENRLTTWRNDPISDMPSEVLYLRDEETADIWTPTPLPTPAPEPYLVRHGAGYTSYEHNSHDLRHRLRLFAATDAPVKIVQLRVTNDTTQPRRLTATYYVEWVLGVDRESTQQFINAEYHEEAHALLARNAYSAEFSEAVAFVAASKPLHSLTADRTEFLGRLQSLAAPEALNRVGLTGRVEPGIDPCAALQIHIDLPPQGSEEIFFLVGQGANREESIALVQEYLNAERVAATWQAVHEHWDAILRTVTVETPDAAMDLLLNRWLLYQALACRIWGRSALYQSSGAYGFRDQLQDVMALIHARPDLTRAQLLRAAQHQFEAGDVLHWWHPPQGRGVRTRITDDLAWLPYVTANYITATDDWGVLDEEVPFRRGDRLREGEEERYANYELTGNQYTLYEHCRRALEKAVTAGRHGIPLMGGGDWNDGMNRVGIEGKGESIWLGWFLHAALTDFARIGETRGDPQLANQLREQANAIREAIEAEGWDGAWYRRAYFDDGTPLGSRENEECQIDAIAQSWSVISGAAEPERARQAMDAVRRQLIKEDERLLLLFTPPFDKTSHDPGYIKGYLPGIRENGGQYTHAALWTIWAFAELGNGDEAEALFRLINPIYRADSMAKADIYKVEPYVIAADVYGVAPHQGRGGWTWYTGSSGWMYRLGIEALLGLRRVGNELVVDPCIPQEWPGFRLTYRHHAAHYAIQVDNPDRICRGVKAVVVDGVQSSTGTIPLADEGSFTVTVTLGK